MGKTEYPYPEDEFDAAGSGRAPEGVHRTPRPRWRAVLPFVVVLVLAPVLAYVGVSFLAGQGEPEGTVTSSPTGDVAGEATQPLGATPAPVEQEARPTATPAPTPEAPPAALDVPVLALNGTAHRGLAASVAQRLRADGFTAVSIGNARSRVPTASTVYYHDAARAPGAQRVAAVLGIERVVENASATEEIAIVLRADYQY